jgi:hypothetical protein
MTQSETDWTTDPDTHHSNASPLFKQLTARITEIIRNDAHILLSGHAESTAGLILAQLTHVHKLAPIVAHDATPLAYERQLVVLMKELDERAFDDTTAEQCAQWKTAAEHLAHAANCMSVLDSIEKGYPNG